MGTMTTPPPTDFQGTLAAAQRGDDAAWRALYLAHAPALLGYLRAQRAPSPEDVVGEVWLQAVRDLSRFSGDERGFRAWLMTIAHHRLLDSRRTTSRRPVEVSEQAGLATPAPGAAIDAQLAAEQELHRLLEGMPERQRSVLYLRFVQDLSQGEVARILGVSTPAMKMLQARALKSLDRRIRELGDADLQDLGRAGVGPLPFDDPRRSGG